MIWLLIFAVALLAFVMLAGVLKAPRAGWEAIIAALLLGLAGYAFQGYPALPGAPHPADQQMLVPASLLIDQRQALSGQPANSDPLLLQSDALVRRGDYTAAVTVLRTGLVRAPNDGEAWLAMGNALVSQAQGLLSPAAVYAYQRAAAAEPDAPGPPFFLGLALMSTGRMTDAKAVWTQLLAHAPPQAPWRANLASRLVQLDQIMAKMRAAGMVP